MAFETLFTPTTLGSLSIPNRVIMAPLTRSRTPDSVPGKMQEAYYGQRAGAGAVAAPAFEARQRPVLARPASAEAPEAQAARR